MYLYILMSFYRQRTHRAIPTDSIGRNAHLLHVIDHLLLCPLPEAPIPVRSFFRCPCTTTFLG